MRELIFCYAVICAIFIPDILTQDEHIGMKLVQVQVEDEENLKPSQHGIPKFDFSRDVIVWNQKWPDGIIYFEISPEFNESSRELIHSAMKEIALKTCITFKEHKNEPDYIYFREKFGDGCHTHAGRKKGKQILNLDPQRCLVMGKVMHELLHVVGFHHEHQRPDRDKYIDIYWDNIKPDDWVQFTAFNAKKRYLHQFPYDYNSILHYGNESFYLAADRTKPILGSKEFAPDLGQRRYLSDIDVAKVNFLYNCDKKKE